ncbi:MAG: hypothetical protein ACRD3G_23225 [Vicinamibacterales bacterium]
MADSQPPRRASHWPLTTKTANLFVHFFACVAIFAVFAVDSTAQQVLDRVVARVGSAAITQTDVEAAVAFGIVDPKAGDPVKLMIDRRLMLAEVNRLPPPEPDMRAIQALMVNMKTAAGPDVNAVMKRTGVDDKRLSELARETLRIQSYVLKRFPTGPRSEEQRARWLNDLRVRGDVAEVPTPR